MEGQPRKRRRKISNTPTRDRKMYARYQCLISEAGDKAPFLGKGYFYELLASEFNIEPATVGIRIRKMLKETTNERSGNTFGE